LTERYSNTWLTGFLLGGGAIEIWIMRNVCAAHGRNAAVLPVRAESQDFKSRCRVFGQQPFRGKTPVPFIGRKALELKKRLSKLPYADSGGEVIVSGRDRNELYFSYLLSTGWPGGLVTVVAATDYCDTQKQV
jgi:hypothetical protein